MAEHVAEHKIVNGVSVDDLSSTMDTLKEKPELAKFQFRAKNKWINGGHNRTNIKGFYGAGKEDTTRTRPYVFDADEPSVLLGGDQGANPVEYVLTALSACLTTSLVYHAAERGIKIDEVESHLEGDLDIRGFLGLSDHVRKGYENIKVTFKVKANAPEEELEELCKYSPVFDIVSNPVPVDIRVEKE
jgi:uncharacterized OsmC-like protein